MYICSQISNILHNHSFSNIIFDIGFNSHCTRLKSCVGLGVDAWFLICLVISFFCLIIIIIIFVLFTRLGLLIFNFWVGSMHLWFVSRFNKDLFFHCSHGEEQIASHDIIWDIFTFIAKNMMFHVSCEQIHVFSLFSF